jgi:hypothetical protein
VDIAALEAALCDEEQKTVDGQQRLAYQALAALPVLLTVARAAERVVGTSGRHTVRKADLSALRVALDAITTDGMKTRVDPPVPIGAVLDAALKAIERDGRFRGVPNGRLEVAWRQAAKGRDGEGDRPPRYAISFECGFDPTSTDSDGEAVAPPSSASGTDGPRDE